MCVCYGEKVGGDFENRGQKKGEPGNDTTNNAADVLVSAALGVTVGESEWRVVELEIEL